MLCGEVTVSGNVSFETKVALESVKKHATGWAMTKEIANPLTVLDVFVTAEDVTLEHVEDVTYVVDSRSDVDVVLDSTTLLEVVDP
ncbi:MAG TPA: hypothetical protein VND41_00770 [Nitrososphaerales archaeon]|nr:hypothetical protein [Nitrososphaerales archaeon]